MIQGPSRTRRIAAAAIAWLAVGCGGKVFGPGDSPDGGPDAPVSVGSCGANGECPTGSTCFFAIGSCSATGECLELPSSGGPTCGALEFLCGCGGVAYTGCGYPSGYGSAPALGPGPCVEEAGPSEPEPGSNLGPCGSDGECPVGATCSFLIGSCDAKGTCFENPSSMCKSEESLCGCGGGMVTTGCAFPEGYASGPTTGSAFCAADGGVGVSDGGISTKDATAH